MTWMVSESIEPCSQILPGEHTSANFRLFGWGKCDIWLQRSVESLIEAGLKLITSRIAHLTTSVVNPYCSVRHTDRDSNSSRWQRWTWRRWRGTRADWSTFNKAHSGSLWASSSSIHSFGIWWLEKVSTDIVRLPTISWLENSIDIFNLLNLKIGSWLFFCWLIFTWFQEHSTRFLTKAFGSPYRGCYALAVVIFSIGIVRDHLWVARHGSGLNPSE